MFLWLNFTIFSSFYILSYCDCNWLRFLRLTVIGIHFSSDFFLGKLQWLEVDGNGSWTFFLAIIHWYKSLTLISLLFFNVQSVIRWCSSFQEHVTKEDARQQFLHIIRALPYGFSVFFNVRKIDDPIGLLPGRIILAINKRGVRLKNDLVS
jgi:hypothetical protein